MRIRAGFPARRWLDNRLSIPFEPPFGGRIRMAGLVTKILGAVRGKIVS